MAYRQRGQRDQEDRREGGKPRERGGRQFPEPRSRPRRRVQPVAPKREKTKFSLKLFGKWDSSVQVKDPSLVNYINLEPRYLPRSAGINRARFHKSKMHIVERLALYMMVPGHIGKRHRLTSGKLAGGLMTTLNAAEKALDLIEQREKKNPVEVLVNAIENAAIREEIISYQLGSITAREAVITAPQRRIDKTLRWFAQGAYRKAFGKKKGLAEALADEIMFAYKNSNESMAVRERDRIEREAEGSR